MAIIGTKRISNQLKFLYGHLGILLRKELGVCGGLNPEAGKKKVKFRTKYVKKNNNKPMKRIKTRITKLKKRNKTLEIRKKT